MQQLNHSKHMLYNSGVGNLFAISCGKTLEYYGWQKIPNFSMYVEKYIQVGEVWDLSDKGTNRTAAFFCHHVIISRSYFTYATDISFFTRPHIFIANRHEM